MNIKANTARTCKLCMSIFHGEERERERRERRVRVKRRERRARWEKEEREEREREREREGWEGGREIKGIVTCILNICWNCRVLTRSYRFCEIEMHNLVIALTQGVTKANRNTSEKKEKGEKRKKKEKKGKRRRTRGKKLEKKWMNKQTAAEKRTIPQWDAKLQFFSFPLPSFLIFTRYLKTLGIFPLFSSNPQAHTHSFHHSYASVTVSVCPACSESGAEKIMTRYAIPYSSWLDRRTSRA